MAHGRHLGPIIPKYYYVSRDGVDAEKANPGSEDRLASNEDAEQGNIFLWGQSVYIISQLLSVFSLSLCLSLSLFSDEQRQNFTAQLYGSTAYAMALYLSVHQTHTHTHMFNSPFVRDYPGEPVAER